MRVYVECYGCWLNKALADVVVQMVINEGGNVVNTLDEAEAAILITCAVRAESERKALERLKFLSKRNLRIAVTGCLVNIRPYQILKTAPNASLIEPGSMSKLRNFLRGDYLFLVRVYGKELLIPKYTGDFRYVLPIQAGCLGACSFCVEPIVRRGVISLDPEIAVNMIDEAVRMGAKEVYLTGQDLAAYGLDLGINLPDLLEEILSVVEGDYRIRIGMMEPWLVKKFVDRLSCLMKDDRIYKYVHLPVQSGDEEVLKIMGRKYTVAEYKYIVTYLRNELKDLSIVTDIIVGFPGEKWEAFMNSVKLIEELLFDKVHLARYTFRPFTPAYIMNPQVPEPEKKRRSRILSEISIKVAAQRNSEYLNRVINALVVEERPGDYIVARTDTYKPVILSANSAKIGDWVKIRIKSFTPFHLEGDIVD
ncbi:MAG: tRNA (N(6)-L-threonylcarbamoyladenosine(37)-C(2))-methylthiotransferase [Thermofilaceae archaeon]